MFLTGGYKCVKCYQVKLTKKCNKVCSIVVMTWKSHILEIDLIIVQNRSSRSFIRSTNLQMQNTTSNTHETVSTTKFFIFVSGRI
jgi:hypothetical protein